MSAPFHIRCVCYTSSSLFCKKSCVRSKRCYCTQYVSSLFYYFITNISYCLKEADKIQSRITESCRKEIKLQISSVSLSHRNEHFSDHAYLPHMSQYFKRMWSMIGFEQNNVCIVMYSRNCGNESGVRLDWHRCCKCIFIFQHVLRTNEEVGGSNGL